ncbi:MAG: kynurenine 3-monooxygenase, mitochondrial precursor [Chrysothrix sp. TS-e1954]|nr:MAG: kynurenine 3-monooxygenase, mitochondrial precursor [Chrysothrix sp. TS-e1954]
MVHSIESGEPVSQSQQYDPRGRHIRATDRSMLNKLLLDELEASPNVTLHFNHKVAQIDFKTKTLAFKVRNGEDGPQRNLEVSYDLLIGADGAHSIVRANLMKITRMFYQQEYIDTMWCEFVISPASSHGSGKDDEFKMPPNYFHLWPAGTCAFIAIANPDKSFTCTLFMPASDFDKIDRDLDLMIPFFDSHFPGICRVLIAESEMKEQYQRNPHLPLISIKCSPYHYQSNTVILGDAAHAMVPFYGQGMNAGLEDVRVLFDNIDAHRLRQDGNRDENLGAALEAYTSQRQADAHAINDLAMKNYKELRADVQSPLYLLRKMIEESLDIYVPSLGWATRYSRVSFSNQRYSEVVKATQKQASILLSMATALGVVGTISLVTFSIWRRQR